MFVRSTRGHGTEGALANTEDRVPKAAAPEIKNMMICCDLAAFMTDAPAISCPVIIPGIEIRPMMLYVFV